MIVVCGGTGAMHILCCGLSLVNCCMWIRHRRCVLYCHARQRGNPHCVEVITVSRYKAIACIDNVACIYNVSHGILVARSSSSRWDSCSMDQYKSCSRSQMARRSPTLLANRT
jgi:hypothetical protein